MLLTAKPVTYLVNLSERDYIRKKNKWCVCTNLPIHLNINLPPSVPLLPTTTYPAMPILGLDPSRYPTKPAHFDIEQVIRPNILALQPYRCARDDYSEGILLDANENALGHSIPSAAQANGAGPALDKELEHTLELDLHRYPSPTHDPIKERIAALRGLPGPEYVFLGVGSDEVIDLLMRVCVAPGTNESILVTPPTYGMYKVCAQVNDVGVVEVPLVLEGREGEGGEKGRFSVRVEEV